MLITSVRDNENKRWKREGGKTKTKRKKGVTQAIVTVWELNILFCV